MISTIIAIIFALLGIVFLATRPKALGVVAIVVAVIFVFMGCTVFMDTGYTGIVTTFGKVEDYTLDSGLKFIKPWQDVVKMNNQKQKEDFTFDVFSADLQQVRVSGSFNHSIDKATAMNLYREVGVKYMDILVNPRLAECVRTVFKSYTAEQLISYRDRLSIEATEMMQKELGEYGVNIIDVTIEDIDFNEAYLAAVEEKQVATQKKLTAQTLQEQHTMEARAEAERKEIAAASEAEIARIKTDAEAYEIRTKADAEAEANMKIAESLTDEYLEYNYVNAYANAWNGELPSTFMGSESSLPIINTMPSPFIGE